MEPMTCETMTCETSQPTGNVVEPAMAGHTATRRCVPCRTYAQSCKGSAAIFVGSCNRVQMTKCEYVLRCGAGHEIDVVSARTIEAHQNAIRCTSSYSDEYRAHGATRRGYDWVPMRRCKTSEEEYGHRETKELGILRPVGDYTEQV